MRVVSLLPSATEMILMLTGPFGLDTRGPVSLVGRSHECDFPHSDVLARVPALTSARTGSQSPAEIDRAVRNQLAAGQSLYTLDAPLLAELRPDVVITQDLCAVCSIDLATVQAVCADLPSRPRILSLNPATFEDVLDDVLRVGEVLGLDRQAQDACVALRQRTYAAADHVNPYAAKPRVTFLEWTDPLFVGGHWTPQLIERAGGEHPLNPSVPIPGSGAAEGPIGQTLRRAGKSVAVPAEILAAARPEFLIVCPCGVGLARAMEETAALAKARWWSELPAVRKGRVAVVDGNQMFSRPGPRLVDALEFLTGWLNDRPELISPGFPWRAWK